LDCTPNVRHHLTFGGAFLLAKFTDEEKMKAVKRYLEGNEGCGTIAKEIGVHVSNLQFWVRKYEYHGEKAFSKSYTNYSFQYKLDVLHCIEYYNHKRIKAKLKGMSPVQYRTHAQQAA
jgi:transposase-like protein